MKRANPSRREVLSALAATGAATLVDLGPVLARVAAQQPCADPTIADTLLGTLPLFRTGSPVQPFGVKFGGAGLDARLVTDLSLLEPERLITPNTLAYIRSALQGVITSGTAAGTFRGFPLHQVYEVRGDVDDALALLPDIEKPLRTLQRRAGYDL